MMPEDLRDSDAQPQHRGTPHAPEPRDINTWARNAKYVVLAIGFSWTVFQLWIASPLPFALGFGVFNSIEIRGLHLAFALTLCFLLYTAHPKQPRPLHSWDVLWAGLGALSAGYLFIFADPLSERSGIYHQYEIILAGIGLALLLMATRRCLGWPLVLLAGAALLYALWGPWMPEIIRHGGVSLERLLTFQWLADNGVFGIPIGVAAEFVFLFVLFGALLERAGASSFFLDLAYGLVGRFRGGPAKGAILASGMTGMISGSSIANVATTGAFTIPAMRRSGLSAEKAGAIEVAASVNGQIMPPIMGAAAFIMAGLTGLPYLDIVKAAFLPAVISYLALFWIAHLEALKLGLCPLSGPDIPQLKATLRNGGVHLIPLAVLIYLLVVSQQSAASAVFYACLTTAALMIIQAARAGHVSTAGLAIAAAFIQAARNMTAISIAVAAAGIIVGVIALTGLGGAMLQVVESIAGDNLYLLLILTAVICIILGMGLPTTANYLVVASLMAPILVTLGGASGLTFSLLAAHMYVFYFGLMADVTPPVGLAAYAASSISRGDPLKTGVQAFAYSIRTAILPLAFIFNAQLLLMDIESWSQAITVFLAALIAVLAVSCVLQNWLRTRLRIWESALLLLAALFLLVPNVILGSFFTDSRPFDMRMATTTAFTMTPDQPVTLAVLRVTPFGDRHLRFVLTPQQDGEGLQALGLKTFGEINRHGQPILVVEDLDPQSPAERAGLDYGDEIEAISQRMGAPPPRPWAYGCGLLILAVVGFSQARHGAWRRKKNGKPQNHPLF